MLSDPLVFPRVAVRGAGIMIDLARGATSAGYGFDPSDAVAPADADVVVVTAADVDTALLELVTAGTGLVVLGADADLSRAGINGAVDETASAVRSTEVSETLAEDLLARVDAEHLSALGRLTLTAPATPLLETAGGPVAAVSSLGAGRVVVLAVGGVHGHPEAARTLISNAAVHAARNTASGRTKTQHPLVSDPRWLALKAAVSAIRPLQIKDGSVPNPENHALATDLVAQITASIVALAPEFPHDDAYLTALVADFRRWADDGFAVPDFLDSLVAFAPASNRVDGLLHLVVFPMYTQNGNLDRNVEAVLLQVIWPEFVAELEAGDYSNKLFLPIRFLDFTAGYDTNSAVLFPETIAMRELPKFTWGGIFADREAARFRRVVTEAAEVTGLQLPPDAARLVADQDLAEQTFVMWDLIHDRTHMHGDLPFDPFMIKQRMPFFLYSLEEMRCDLTAFRESVELEKQGNPHARLVQYAVIFDRIFRFSITGSRVRNYDGLGGQLLFAWLHQHRVLHWTDNRLSIEWDKVTEPVLELGRRIEDLYWRSIDRPKVAHWLAAYELVSSVVTPHPLSAWARYTAGDREALPLDGPPKGLTDAVLPDEFPLSMFFEALDKKMKDVVTGTAGITG